MEEVQEPAGESQGVRLVPCDNDKNPFAIKSERDSLADAERPLSRAIALDPTMTEAYVRLAHVRTLRGRAADAQTLLATLPPSADVRVTFHAAMVEGKMLEALGRLDDAAAAYQRAVDPSTGERPPTDPMVTCGFGRGPDAAAAWSTLIAALEACR